ncbi:DNA recombination protein RmuC [Parvularcula bermudensis]|nr:DNA recombination protein RmuC [Parvularcula bermudensis]
MTAQFPSVPFEEEMARAEEALAMLQDDPSFWGQNMGWIIGVGAIILVVVAMLAILVGRQRRSADASYRAQGTPLFDDRDDGYADDMPFAEVIIERDSAEDEMAEMPDEETAVSEGNDFTDARGDETVEAEKARPAPRSAPARDFRQWQQRRRATDTAEEQDPAKVVPLRSVETAQAAPAAFADLDEGEGSRDAAAEEGGPTPLRYAYGGRTTSRQDGPTVHGQAGGQAGLQSGAPAAPSSSGAFASRSRGEADESLSSGERPYIAPFIREDIERSERRQGQRIDDLKSDIASRFDRLQREQLARLDRLVTTIDHRLEAHGERPEDPTEALRDIDHAIGSLRRDLDRVSLSLDEQGRVARDMGDRIDDRLQDLPRLKTALEDLVDRVSDDKDEEEAAGLLRALDRTLDGLRDSFRDLADQVAALQETSARQAHAQSRPMASASLSDVVRMALPDHEVAFGVTLRTGYVVDCAIELDGHRGLVSIDTGFPTEVFDDLASDLAAIQLNEQAIRYEIRELIRDAEERAISPGETIEGCLLYIPSEHAFTLLNERFPELVREARRRHVWFASPASLTTLLGLIDALHPSEMAGPSGGGAAAPGDQAADRPSFPDSWGMDAARPPLTHRSEPEPMPETQMQRLQRENDDLRQRADSTQAELMRLRTALSGVIGADASASHDMALSSSPADAESRLDLPEPRTGARTGGTGARTAARTVDWLSGASASDWLGGTTDTASLFTGPKGPLSR